MILNVLSRSLLSLLHNHRPSAQIWADCVMVFKTNVSAKRRAKGRRDHAAIRDARYVKVMEKCLWTDCDSYWICSICEHRHKQQASMHTKTERRQWHNPDEDGDKLCFFGGARGLKVSDRQIRDSSSSEFTLLVCLTQDSSGRSLLLSVRTQSEKKKSHSLSTHEWVASTSVCVCLYMWYCACGFCIGTAVWFLTVMMWGLHRLTDGRERIRTETKDEAGEKREQQKQREKFCHTVKQQQTIANCGTIVYLFRSAFLCLFFAFFSLSGCRFLLLTGYVPVLYLHPSPSLNPGSHADVV